MKTAYTMDRFRRACLQAEPEEYDGRAQLPVRTLDLAPQRLNRFREGLASVLPFLDRVNGPLRTERPVYPLTASLLREYAEPFEALATEVEWKPADIPTGTGRLVIRLARDGERVSPSKDHPDTFEMVLARSDEYRGYLSTTTGCVVGSNAWLVRTLDGDNALALTLVAFGLLFAEDYDAKVLEVEVPVIPAKHEVLSQLLESTGLQLVLREVTHDGVR